MGCHPAKIHDGHPHDAPGNEIYPEFICLFNHKHFNESTIRRQFEAARQAETIFMSAH